MRRLVKFNWDKIRGGLIFEDPEDHYMEYSFFLAGFGEISFILN